jgi:hypothetical protein
MNWLRIKIFTLWYFIIWGIPALCRKNGDLRIAWAAAKIAAYCRK